MSAPNVLSKGTLFLVINLPSTSLFGVLDAPSARRSAGLGGGVCTREPDAFRLVIGADIDGLRLTKLSGRPSSPSRSLVGPVNNENIKRLKN